MIIPDIMSVRVRAPASAAPSGWWLSGGVAAANCLAAYTPIGAASLAASYDNNAAPGNGLADGTYDAAPGTAPAWAAASGWSFALASSQYLTTGITIPNTTYSAIARFSNVTVPAGTKEGYLIGSFQDLAKYWGIAPVGYAGENKVYYCWGRYVQITPGLSSGVLAIAGLQPYRNGIAEASTIPSGMTSGKALYIGAINGSAGYYLTGKIQALAIYSVTLTADQVAAISAAMAALTG